MALPVLILTTLLSACVNAHTRFTTLHINGQSQGDGVCIRQDQDPDTTTNYVPSITGPEMACGVDGTIANPSTCNANAGDQISLEHRMWPDGSQPGAIDVSHKGNTAVYMKKINSQSNEVTGNGWFKIYWDGYDTATGEWGTDHMNANNGMVTTTIPNDLAAGNYLVRSEVLALQEVGEPQFSMGCAQIQLFGSGSAAPSDTATIPGYVDMSTPDMNVDIYETFTFTEYGPVTYGSGGSASTATNTTTSTSTKAGLGANLGGTGTDVPSISASISTPSASIPSLPAESTNADSFTDEDNSIGDQSMGQSGRTTWDVIIADDTSIEADAADRSDGDDKNGAAIWHDWEHRWAKWNHADKRIARHIQAARL